MSQGPNASMDTILPLLSDKTTEEELLSLGIKAEAWKHKYLSYDYSLLLYFPNHCIIHIVWFPFETTPDISELCHEFSYDWDVVRSNWKEKSFYYGETVPMSDLPSGWVTPLQKWRKKYPNDPRGKPISARGLLEEG